MHRIAFVVIALTASSAAFACGGGACSNKNCKMPQASAPVDLADVEGTQLTLNVTGMKCGACADKIRAALVGIDGVAAANVDAETGEAKVAFDAEKTNADAMIAAIADVGHFEAKAAEKS